MTAIVNQGTCDGCGECVQACPLDAIKIENEKAVVDPDVCSDCGACVDVCPTQSISLS
jgi:NAD-dependent dihydropyrimidine dehydrogenase PreA subunit